MGRERNERWEKEREDHKERENGKKERLVECCRMEKTDSAAAQVNDSSQTLLMMDRESHFRFDSFSWIHFSCFISVRVFTIVLSWGSSCYLLPTHRSLQLAKNKVIWRGFNNLCKRQLTGCVILIKIKWPSHHHHDAFTNSSHVASCDNLTDRLPYSIILVVQFTVTQEIQAENTPCEWEKRKNDRSVYWFPWLSPVSVIK